MEMETDPNAAAREMVLAGSCPFCGTGWTSLSIHLAKKHGERVRDFKSRLGIPWSRPIDSPELLERLAENARAMRKVESMRANPARRRWVDSPPGRQRKRQGAALAAPSRRKIPIDVLPMLAERAAAGERLADLAAPFGAGATALCMALKKWRLSQ